MPTRPPSPCTFPHCPALVAGFSRCATHRRQAERARGTAQERLYGHRWDNARRAFRRRHPLCAPCEATGRVTAADTVDHIIPHRGDQARFWDRTNCRACCRSCHSRKTVRYDGGFGRPRSEVLHGG